MCAHLMLLVYACVMCSTLHDWSFARLLPHGCTREISPKTVILLSAEFNDGGLNKVNVIAFACTEMNSSIVFRIIV